MPGQHFDPKIEILSNNVEDDDIVINDGDDMLSPVHLTESEEYIDSRHVMFSEQLLHKVNQSH